MAVIRINYVKKGKAERATAKANIRYIQHRRGKDGAEITRILFGAGGQMSRQQAYAMIDGAGEGSTFFRIKICPDPKAEDTKRDLLMREITEKTMDLEEQLGEPVAWVAAIHDDHTDKRHVHVLAVARTRMLPAKTMIQTATRACLDLRRELDTGWERHKEHERDTAGRERTRRKNE